MRERGRKTNTQGKVKNAEEKVQREGMGVGRRTNKKFGMEDSGLTYRVFISRRGSSLETYHKVVGRNKGGH